MVSHFGAMQAQDYAMSKWAVGIRLAATECAVEQSITNGEIIRTHVLRPTWHLVAAEDIRWMLDLTAPQVKKQYLSMCNTLDVDGKALKSYNKTIAKALKDNKHLTREEIMQRLKLKGSYTNDVRPALIMMNAEQEGIVCNGPMRGKQFTYALMDERVPDAKKLIKEEALEKLAARYFRSHGPATLQDFTWWSGLSVADSKLALELTKHNLHSVGVGGLVYWFYEPHLSAALDTDSVHFLPAFDEFLISYKDRTASIPVTHQPNAFTRNGIFKPVIVANGKVVGTWKRTLKGDTVVIETGYFGTVKKAQKKELLRAAELFGAHMERKVIIN